MKLRTLYVLIAKAYSLLNIILYGKLHKQKKPANFTQKPTDRHSSKIVIKLKSTRKFSKPVTMPNIKKKGKEMAIHDLKLHRWHPHHLDIFHLPKVT